jgi:hypothetical protein
MLYQVLLGKTVTAGAEIANGIVVDAAPILGKFIGQELPQLREWVLRNGGHIRSVSLSRSLPDELDRPEVEWLRAAKLNIHARKVLLEAGFKSKEEVEARTIVGMTKLPGCSRQTALVIASAFHLKPYNFDIQRALYPFYPTHIAALAATGNIVAKAPYRTNGGH